MLAERIRHADRIKGLLATQGVFGFGPTLRDRRARLAAARRPEGEALPPRLSDEILRQVDRLELVMQQLAAVEAARDAVFAAERAISPDHGAATNCESDGAVAGFVDTEIMVFHEVGGC